MNTTSMTMLRDLDLFNLEKGWLQGKLSKVSAKVSLKAHDHFWPITSHVFV